MLFVDTAERIEESNQKNTDSSHQSSISAAGSKKTVGSTIHKTRAYAHIWKTTGQVSAFCVVVKKVLLVMERHQCNKSKKLC